MYRQTAAVIPAAAVIVAAAALLGCGDDTTPVGAAGGTGGIASTGGAGGTGGTGATGGMAGTGGMLSVHPGVLVDDGLVARYYIDEANEGQTPTELLDAAENPLNLPITYVNELGLEMTFYEDAEGHRGLQFLRAGADDRAGIPIDGTKIHTALEGSTSMTYEAVLRADALSTSGTRFMHIGKEQDHTLTLESNARFRIQTEAMSQLGASVAVDLSAARIVVHAVLDTTQEQPADRHRIYVDGSRLPALEGTPPAQGLALALETERDFVIGNRKMLERSPQGEIYYAAVYAVPLSAEQVAQNAALLLVDDDTPTP